MTWLLMRDNQSPENSPNRDTMRLSRDGTSLFLRDHLGNRYDIGGGASESTLEYGTIQLNRTSNPQATSAVTFPDLNSSIGNTYLLKWPHTGSVLLSSNYQDCLWDIYEYAPFNWALVNSWTKQTFTNADEAYAYLSTRAASSGGNFTNDIYARLYDIVDDSIMPIRKMYGMNTFYSMIKWRHYNGSGGYKTTWASYNFMWEPLTSRIRWQRWESFIEDAIQKLTPASSYVYNAAHEPWKCVWNASNYRKIYWGIKQGWKVAHWGWQRRYIDGTTLIPSNVSPSGDYDVQSGGASRYYMMDLQNYSAVSDNWVSYAKDTPRHIYANQRYNKYSFLVAYSLLLSWTPNKYAIFVKPVWVDTVNIDYFDTDIYDLYAVYNAKNEYQRVKKIDTLWLSRFSWWNVIRLTKEDWYEMPDYHVGKVTKEWYTKLPKIQFFLKNKTTKKISRPSKKVLTPVWPTRDMSIHRQVK